LPDETPRKPRLTHSQRRALGLTRLSVFLQKYGRTSRRGGYDPNDRTYDRDLERRMKTMDPLRLDQLMRGDED